MNTARHRAPQTDDDRAQLDPCARHDQSAYRWALVSLAGAVLSFVVAVTLMSLDLWP